MLHVHAEYGEPVLHRNKKYIGLHRDGTWIEDDRWIEHEVLQFESDLDGKIYRSDGRSRYNTFDEQLDSIVQLMPNDCWPKICWTCNYCDYFLGGSGVMGNLACFRNTKEEYLRVTGKKQLVDQWDRRAEYVQEIYLCPVYAKCQQGSGLNVEYAIYLRRPQT